MQSFYCVASALAVYVHMYVCMCVCTNSLGYVLCWSSLHMVEWLHSSVEVAKTIWLPCGLVFLRSVHTPDTQVSTVMVYLFLHSDLYCTLCEWCIALGPLPVTVSEILRTFIARICGSTHCEGIVRKLAATHLPMAARQPHLHFCCTCERKCSLV